MYVLKRVLWKIDIWKCFIFLLFKRQNWGTLKFLLFAQFKNLDAEFCNVF